MNATVQYLGLLFVSYLGLVSGTTISYKVKEELKKGRRYFKLLKTIVFAIIFFLFMLHLGINLVLVILFTLITLVFFRLWEKRTKYINTDMFLYSFFAVILYETFSTKNAPVFATLIFVFGLLVSSIKFQPQISLLSNLKKAMGANAIYPILGVVISTMLRT